MASQGTTVDFIAQGASPSEWKMVLVESGPWEGALGPHLHRLQDRLYGCLDAAIDGQLAEKFPQSKGGRVVIQLDCYDLPRDELQAFFDRFSQGVLQTPDYVQALAASRWVRQVGWEINFGTAR